MKKTKQRLLGVFLTSALLLVTVFALASAQNTYDGELASKATSDISDTGLANYIVVLTDAPVASYRGNIEGLSATNPYVNGESDLKTSEATVAYASFLETQQNNVISNLEVTLSRDLEVKDTFQYALNGFVAVLTAEEAKLISGMDGIHLVQRDFERELHTDVGPQWIGADTIWNATSVMTGTKGEGIVVAILDTGINHDHPSFADIAGDGYDHTNPFGSGNYVPGSYCDVTDPTFCNDKLIGAWGYIGNGDPGDDDGHGTHTASTVAGNYLTSTLIGPTTALTKTISGVAPRANIISYDVCCTGTGILSGIEQVVIDHMALLDAGHETGIASINYSIGSSAAGEPWIELDSLAFLAASDAGVVPVTSNGNDGPESATTGSPADTPWMISVGASTHNRALVNSLVNITTTMGMTPLADIESVGFTSGYGPAELVYAGDYPNPNDPNNDPAQCLQPYPAGTFNGEIVVCDRGAIARVAKGQNVLAGGAGGFVLANLDAQGDSVTGDAHFLPGIHIGDTDGDIVRAYLADAVANGDTVYATITGATYEVADENGDIMAGFSSRGPVRNGVSVIKPDITAPGVSIWAAYADNPGGLDEGAEYSFLSGTSMSSPHVAGSAALMTALYPDWTPSQIRSALMLSSNTNHLKEDGVTPADPFDMGSGRVDLALAPNVGFVLNETTANFEAANPANGGDPSTLNLASMANEQCLVVCSWTRTVESTLDYTETWTITFDVPVDMSLSVTPTSFDLAPGATQEIEITADVSALPNDGTWTFAELTFVPTMTATVPTVHMPIAVVASDTIIPDDLFIETQLRSDMQVVDGFASAVDVVEYNSNSYGLVAGMVMTDMLSVDPTNGDPYDNLNDGTTFFVTVNVEAGDVRLVAETFDSTASDLDLYVGTGDTPSAATEVCASTTATAVEYCNIDDPAAGTWWILVQNWQESTNSPDFTLLSYAVVDTTDAGNMTVDGPSGVNAGDVFSVTVNWDEPAFEAGDRWYGAFSSGVDSGDADSLGTINVDIHYTGTPEVVADDSVSASVAPDGMATKTYMIGNTGNADLDWSIRQGAMSVEVVPSNSVASPAAASASLVGSLVEESTEAGLLSVNTPAGGNIIWNQDVNGTSGIVSDYSIADGGGGYSANDFVLSGGTQIDTIFTPGFDNGNILANQSLISWVIYADDNGAPVGNPDTSPPNYDDAVWFYTSAVDGAGVDITDNNIFLDLDAANVDLVLPGGTYWLSVFVNYDSFTTGRWNWYQSAQVGEQTQLVGNLFGVADWTGLGDLGLSFSETAFTLTGMGTCVPNDLSWVSLAPTSGTTAPGEMSYVDVMFDATGVGVGSYSGVVCIDTNDPMVPYVELTVNMDVTTATANLQAIHLAPFASGDAAVDVMVNGSTVVTDLVFGEATGYLALPAGTHEVEIALAGTSTVALSGVYTLTEDVDYSLIAIGGANGYPLELIALVDNDPAAGGVTPSTVQGGSVGYVRVGHLAPFAPVLADTAVNIINDADGSTVVPNVTYGAVTGYLPLPVGVYDLSIELVDGTPLFDLAPVTVEADSYIAAFAIGDGVNQANDVVAATGEGGMMPSIIQTTRYIYLPFVTNPAP